MRARGLYGKVGPRRRNKLVLNEFPGIGRTGGDHDGLLFIDSETRDKRERRDDDEGRGDAEHGVGKNGDVVSKSEEGDVRVEREGVDEGIVGDDEEEGGEGATLLNPRSSRGSRLRKRGTPLLL